MGFFERGERVFETPPHGAVGRRRAIPFERLTQPQLQLAGRFLRERHRHDAVHRRAARRQYTQDALDERGGLAGAGRGFDDKRVVEGVDDRQAGRRVGQRGGGCHRIDLSAIRSASSC